MQQRTRFFTASEVAEFEYCPLAWWHEQFEPLAQADTEALFAHLVELEHAHGSQAPMLPEYQMVEQLLLRRGAFDEGEQQHHEHAEAVAEIEEEQRIPLVGNIRRFALIAIALLIVALLLIGIALLLR